MHYNCEKLTKEQIKMVEDAFDQDYCCTFCSQKEISAQSSVVSVLPTLTEDQSSTECSAQTALDEDSDYALCNVCCDRVKNGNGEVSSMSH